MNQKIFHLSIHQKWLILFGVWMVFLSGGFSSLSPGILQALRVKGLLDSKKEHLELMRQDLSKTRMEISELEHSRPAQVREIRKVLGYAAPDELVFDFKTSD